MGAAESTCGVVEGQPRVLQGTRSPGLDRQFSLEERFVVGIRLHVSEQSRTENEHSFGAKDEGTRLQPYRRCSDLSSTSDLPSDRKEQ
jgi:hypothetical protein